MSLLDNLLQADANKVTEKPTKVIELGRLTKVLGNKAEFTVTALDPERHADIQRTSVDFNKKGSIRDLKLFEMQVLTLIDGVVEPSLKDKDLLAHFGVATPKELVKKLFLAGEISDLYGAINELSGYDKDDEEVNEEIKN